MVDTKGGEVMCELIKRQLLDAVHLVYPKILSFQSEIRQLPIYFKNQNWYNENL